MEGDEDEPSNASGPALGFKEDLVSDREECVEIPSSEVPCESEVFPLVSKSQSVAPRISWDSDIDVVLREVSVEVDADLVTENRDLAEEMKMAREEVDGDFVEDMGEEIEAKVRTCVTDEPLLRKNLASHSAQEVDMHGIGVFNTVEYTAGETLAIGDDDVQEKAEATGILGEKEDTEVAGETKAEEETTIANITFAVQDTEEVYMTNVQEKAEVTVISDEKEETIIANMTYAGQDTEEVYMTNVVEETVLTVKEDVPVLAEVIKEVEEEEAGENEAVEETTIANITYAGQDIEEVHMTNVVEETVITVKEDVPVLAEVIKEVEEEARENEAVEETTIANMTYAGQDIEEVHMTNVVEETVITVKEDVPVLAAVIKEVEEEEAGENEAVEETTIANMTYAGQDIEEVHMTNVVEETVITVKEDVPVLAEVIKEVEEEVGATNEFKDSGFVSFGYAQDIDAVNLTDVGLETDSPKNAEDAAEAIATDEEGMDITDKSAMTEDIQETDDGDVPGFEKVVEEIKLVKVVDGEVEMADASEIIHDTGTVEGKVPERPEDADYVKDEFSSLKESDLAVPLQDLEQEVDTDKSNETETKEKITRGVNDVGEDQAEDEMDNMADDIAEDEMDYMGNDILDMEEISNLGEETVGAIDMINVTDEIVETEEMDVYVSDRTADEAQGMELLDEVEEAGTGSTGGKRKRGRNSKAPVRTPLKKKVEEDVCFICFDGGDLVLCDRRGCPKAYHPSCVNRDEAFFRAKGRWNCGWHLCSNCGKTANYMCLTCTFSLCKSCVKDAIIFCVRGNKGFCETCMKTVILIEKNEHGSRETGQVDFNDKSSWEYLFKDYWSDVKQKLSLTYDELTQAKVPWKGSDMLASKQESPHELDNKVDRESDSHSSGNLNSNVSKRKKPKKLLKSRSKERDSSHSLKVTNVEGISAAERIEWASKELLEFIMHMRSGDRSVLSQFDVQALLLEYIKRNKLRDPRRKSQIVCDIRLETLFGKPRVGHFEMLKLLESHFLLKDDAMADDLQGSVVDTESAQMEVYGTTDSVVKAGKDRKRKGRKKSNGKGLQYNVDDYAAINSHNINLIYLKRNLVEELIDDVENFLNKVVGTFVRIRISGNNAQKQDLYRLVQVVGTSKAGEPYKVGKKMTNILLEILNLNKTEIISSDIISNQEFTEDECKRLRQSIKCGLLSRLTVGDVQEKAMALQEVRVKDWLEAEIVRLSHLRDRASEKGHRKEECVEKLQLLKTPEERQRRLEEIADIHSDPNMDPSHESEEEKETYIKPRSNNGFGRKGKEIISPRKGGSSLSDNWSGMRNLSNTNMESNKNSLGKSYSNKVDDAIGSSDIAKDYTRNQGRETNIQLLISEEKKQTYSVTEIGPRKTQSIVESHLSSARELQISAAPLSTVANQTESKINEAEKMWHYKDPSGKVQGPFSIVQLRKWNTTGYFPADLRIWNTAEKEDDSILLSDALAGKFHRDLLVMDNSIPEAEIARNSNLLSYSGKSQGLPLQHIVESWNHGASDTRSTPSSSGPSAQESVRFQNEVSSTIRVPPSIEVPKFSMDGRTSDHGIRNESANLPSPTPSSGGAKGHPPLSESNSFSGGNTGLQHSVVFPRDSAARSSEGPDNSVGIGSFNTLQMHADSTGAAPSLDEVALNPSADIKSISANLQSLVQSLNSRSVPIQTEGWTSSSVPRPEMNAPGPATVNDSKAWGSAPSYKVEAANNTSAVPAQLPHGQWGGPQVNFQAIPTGAWRPPAQSSQPNLQSPVPTNLPWGMGLENQNNTGWVPPHQGTPNIGWTGPPPAVVNPNWAAQAPPSGNVNQGWAAPPQGPTPGNVVPSWGPGTYNQPLPPPSSANTGWIPPPGNPNPGWGLPVGNVGVGGNEHREWGRQPSFNGGGGFPRPPFKGQRVCKYHESGHCKKGAACDYLHT